MELYIYIDACIMLKNVHMFTILQPHGCMSYGMLLLWFQHSASSLPTASQNYQQVFSLLWAFRALKYEPRFDFRHVLANDSQSLPFLKQFCWCKGFLATVTFLRLTSASSGFRNLEINAPLEMNDRHLCSSHNCCCLTLLSNTRQKLVYGVSAA